MSPLFPQTGFSQETSVLSSIPIIDTHQHLWDLSKFKLPWQTGEDTKPIEKSFVTSDYLEATRGLNIVKTVYMEVDVVPEQQQAEADYVIDLCRRGDNPMKAAVISGRPGTPGFEPYIRKLAQNKYIKGVRQVLHGDNTPAGYCLQPKFVESIQLLGELGLSFDLCLRSGEVLDAVKLVDQCPKTRFIIDHCGNMSVTSTDKAARQRWLDGMKEMAARKSTVCKVSGIVVTANKNWKPEDLAPNINDTINTFGDDRVMFAGDWPVCTLRASFAQWVNALKQIVKGRSPEFHKKLFQDNAAKFYGI
ncbi:MAG: amidohydrolase [Planctomycetes bacterium]|nr:amidohydrolase [Planctomycetota bacterium]